MHVVYAKKFSTFQFINYPLFELCLAIMVNQSYNSMHMVQGMALSFAEWVWFHYFFNFFFKMYSSFFLVVLRQDQMVTIGRERESIPSL